MGLMQHFFKKIKFPSFPVFIYGKLPCHKEYLRAGSDPLFAELERKLDSGFERRISDQQPPPHVLPDRRFYLYGDGNNDLVGCVFESNDGQRHFPFIMAATLPARLFRRKPFPVTWQILDKLWVYLEAYYGDLRGRGDASSVYAAVRGVVHTPEPFVPEEVEPVPEAVACERDEQGRTRITVPRQGLGPDRIPLDDLPRWLLWPGANWTRQFEGEVTACWGSRGLADIDTEQFREDGHALEAGESLVPELIHPDGDSDDDPIPPEPESVETEPDEQPPMFSAPLPLEKREEI